MRWATYTRLRERIDPLQAAAGWSYHPPRADPAVHRTKSGKSRYLPMTHRLHAAMREHFARRRLSGSAWVFHHETARRGCAAMDRVTTWLAEGKNAVHVKEALGHSDLRTTMGYTHLSKMHLRSLVDAPAQPISAAEKHA